MFNPEMMQAAQKMMANMKPEDMQRMSQMAANMDPKVMEGMMKNMGAPGGFDASQLAQATEQMKNMSPEQLQAGMSQAQNQMNSQKQYYCNAAEMLKNEGNAHVKAERYSEALPKYSKALENLKDYSGADVSALKLSLLNNSALCHLKTKHFGEALESCEEVLRLDARNFKALFRRGQAQAGMGNLSEAVLDVRQASTLQPSDKAISAELEQLRGQLRERGIDEAGLKREGKHEVSAVWQEQGGQPASSSSAPAPAVDDRWVKAASSLAENPDMLKQATDAMSQIKPEDLERMMGSQPLPPGMDAKMMRSQMEHLQKNPEMLKTAMESLKAMPEDQRKQMLAARGLASGGGGGGAPAMPSPSDASAIFDNPEMLQQAIGMTQGMTDDDLSRLGVSSPEEGKAMREAAAQMASNPEMMRSMSEMMKNMSPEQMENMMNMSAKMRGGAGPGAGGPGDGPPDMASMMNDPDMMKATEDMMKNISPEMLQSMMSPEMLQSISKSSGVEIDEGRAKTIAKVLPWVLPWLMRFMRWFSYLRKVWSSSWNRKRIGLSVLVVIVAMIQHCRGW